MKVRTVVVTMSPLLADIVLNYLQSYLTIDVVGVLQDRAALAERLAEIRPDLVLLGLTEAESDACARPLLALLPSARFLVLAPNGQHAWLHELRPHRLTLRHLSKRGLLRTLASRYGSSGPAG
jgi:DNA-binding NarL/FixJ family response regulator